MNFAKYSQLATIFVNQSLYALKVGQQLAVKVYQRENMSPPTSKELEASVTGFKEVVKRAVQMAKSKQLPNVQQLKITGRVGLELLGFFTIGEIIGRRNIIGYKVNKS
eukprot:NODE_409_length_9212_cov_0.585537.p13 type:complete len:108 gc:universal NODE_409_length_9212_cov_0.585537:1601-1278(-)